MTDTPDNLPPGAPAPNQKLPISITDEMRTSYLDYAMSVIIGRAIPDARDGLKPVHRRILYAAYENKLMPSGPHRKSATIVGEVLGKYHPHGDASVYDAMVRLAQSFSMRYPLIDGQGNFGSVDGDPAAAYRYTEARLSRISVELLTDLDKQCVDFSPNFDDRLQEPTVLPARFPNLLVNGTNGIAVGMATNIPPHNLGEIIDATVHLIREPGATVDDLMRFVQGPDFPTGAVIHGRGGIQQAYRTGRGAIIMRAPTKVEQQPGKSDREQVVVTALPYQVNKARVIEKINELRSDKKLEGIAEGRDAVRDESDREENIRIVLELKKDVLPQIVINQLYRMTDLQATFGVINLAIVAGRPKVLDLRQTLQVFVDHRRDVVTRRTRFELRQAEAQRELVEGLGMAITEVDTVIGVIRKSKDPEEARAKLTALPLMGLEAFVRRAGRPQTEIDLAKERGAYHLSDRQAKAILEMRLSRLTALESDKLAAEYGELCDTIARLRTILADEKALLNVIVVELEEIKANYADARRTEIVTDGAELVEEDLIQEEDMVVTISHAGYVKRTPTSTYRSQRRGGKGRMGMEAREEDWVTQLFVASTHTYVFFFTNKGKVFVKKVWEIPQGNRAAKGRAIVNFVSLEEAEKVLAVVPVPAIEKGKFVVTMTKRGQIKKTELDQFENFREKGIIGVKIEPGDELLAAVLTDGTCELLLATKSGLSIRFPEAQVRPTGRATMGVKGIDLGETDQVVGLAVTEPERPYVLAVCEKGFGKRTNIAEFRTQNRGGKGVILIDASDRNGGVVDLKLVKDGDQVMLMTDRGQTLRTTVAEIRETGRNAQGVKIMAVAEDEKVVAVERVAESDDGGGTGESIQPPSTMPPPGDTEVN